jgi:hypothetical protein
VYPSPLIRANVRCFSGVSECDFPAIIVYLFTILLSYALVNAVKILSPIFRLKDTVFSLKLVNVFMTPKDLSEDTYRYSTIRPILLRHFNSTVVAFFELDDLTAFFVFIDYLLTSSRSPSVYITLNCPLIRVILLLALVCWYKTVRRWRRRRMVYWQVSDR